MIGSNEKEASASSDLDKIKRLHAEAMAARKAEAAAQESRRYALAQRREDAAREWIAVSNTIDLLLTRINDDLSDAGLRLDRRPPQGGDDKRIDQVMIDLTGTTKEKQLVLNVDLDGNIRPVVLIPHSGPSRSSFAVGEANADRLKAEILAFLEAAVTS